METLSSGSENSAQSTATEWNDALAKRVTRWKRLRLAAAIVLTAVGIATLFAGPASIWSVPCFIVAFIAYLLYLDSRDQIREIRARRWSAITPRIGRGTARKRGDAEAILPS
ncbi:MAG: hypothetical protein HQ567_17910 [Candidatus Nealsonbacteria bacterium]|nr:hypothetical protein [Candidatus Nealsonbacteria bacterium]